MDDLERRIAAELAAADPADQPAPWLGPSILARVRHRRRWRAVAAATTAATAVAAIATSAVVLLAGPAPRPAAPAVLPSPGPITPQPTRRADLDDLIDPHTMARVPSWLPDGSRFEVLAVDAAGALVGRRSNTSAGPEDVWIAGPAQPAPVRVQDTPPDRYLWIMAVDGDTHVWPDGESLKCADGADRGRVRVLDRRWGGRMSFYADGGAIVWTREDGRVRVAQGCHGRVRKLPANGVLDAVAYPYAFVRDTDGLRQVDVRDGQAQLVPGAPPLISSPTAFVPMTLAANATLVAWGEAATVTTLDRVTGARRLYKPDLPLAGNPMYFTGLTAGNRLLAYSMWHQDSGAAYSVVLDPRTGRTAAVHGRVWAAGDWLVWQDGGDYKIARVRA